MNHVREEIHCEAAYKMGITGRGIGIAILDTGIYPHQDFEHRLAAFVDVVHHRREPYDDNGHGTHISGIIGGSGAASDERYRGIAPECHLIMLKVLDKKGNGYASDVLAGLKWIRDNRERYGIRIVNISVGSFSKKGMNENSVLVRGVNAVWDDGLVVCVAAGNMGPGENTITTPGISRKVITIGCSDDYKEVNVMGNRMIDYSGRGPTRACICKPEIIAPGAGIMSCANESGQYLTKSGTSMSTPLVSGAIALLLQKYPYMTNRDVKLMLRERAVDMGLPMNQQGWGMLDIEKLLE